MTHDHVGEFSIDCVICLRERIAELETRLTALLIDPCRTTDEAKARIAELEKDKAFYKSCALSGEVPKDGDEPSARHTEILQKAIEMVKQASTVEELENVLIELSKWGKEGKQ